MIQRERSIAPILGPEPGSSQAEPRPELFQCIRCATRPQPRNIGIVNARRQLRDLPAVNDVLERLPGLLARFPRALVVEEVRRAIDAARRDILDGSSGDPMSAIEQQVAQALDGLERPGLRRVINAT